jgi:integrase
MRKPKYRRHTTRDRAFLEFDGKRHYLPGPYKSQQSLTAYRTFLRAHNLLFEQIDGKPVHVVALVNRFMDWAENTYPVGTRSEWMNCRAALKHLNALDGKTQIANYGPMRLKALQQELARAKKSRGYINSVCARVKRMFKWAVSEELAPAAIYHALATVPGLKAGRTQALEHAPRQPVPWEHVDPVLLELSDTVSDMVRLQWLTGARSQSICQAGPGQFNRDPQPWEWRPRHKMESAGHELVIYLGPQAQKIVAPYLELGQAYLFQPKHMSGQRARGYRSFYDAVSYLRAITRAIDRVNRARVKAGADPIPYWTPHQLRHARATLLRASYGLEGSQAAIGHKSLAAHQIYAQRQSGLAKKIALEVG